MQDRFANILGRQPIPAEVNELMMDKDEIGLIYHDPLLIQLMALKGEKIGLEEVFPRHIAEFGKQCGFLAMSITIPNRCRSSFRSDGDHDSDRASGASSNGEKELL